RQRASIKEATATPVEILAEYLEHHIGNTLVLSAKASSNLDNVVLRPFNMLLVRHEIDSGIIHIARSSIMEYCTEHRVSFRKIESALESSGVLTHRNVQKVLGADTQYAKGQTRTWRIDAKKLDPKTLPATLAAKTTA
ncbi:MAG: hypothetical protein ACKO0Z_20995, partial [Betaproteobacteria bacterium]